MILDQCLVSSNRNTIRKIDPERRDTLRRLESASRCMRKLREILRIKWKASELLKIAKLRIFSNALIPCDTILKARLMS